MCHHLVPSGQKCRQASDYKDNSIDGSIGLRVWALLVLTTVTVVVVIEFCCFGAISAITCNNVGRA